MDMLLQLFKLKGSAAEDQTKYYECVDGKKTDMWFVICRHLWLYHAKGLTSLS